MSSKQLKIAPEPGWDRTRDPLPLWDVGEGLLVRWIVGALKYIYRRSKSPHDPAQYGAAWLLQFESSTEGLHRLYEDKLPLEVQPRFRAAIAAALKQLSGENELEPARDLVYLTGMLKASEVYPAIVDVLRAHPTDETLLSDAISVFAQLEADPHARSALAAVGQLKQVDRDLRAQIDEILRRGGLL